MCLLPENKNDGPKQDEEDNDARHDGTLPLAEGRRDSLLCEHRGAVSYATDVAAALLFSVHA